MSVGMLTSKISDDGAAMLTLVFAFYQGSIGTQTLDICREKPENFEVVSLAAGSNVDLLAEQIAYFK